MNIEIADRLVALRRESGLSQEELAAKLGVSRQAVSKWERAESSPDTDNLIALARLYGVSLDGLLLSDDGGCACQAAPNPDARENPFSAPAPEAPQAPSFSQPYGEEEELFSAADQWDAEEDAWKRERWRRRRHFLLRFPYPVVIVFIYLLLGFSLGWWHPGWMLFLTVPIYYCVLAAVKD